MQGRKTNKIFPRDQNNKSFTGKLQKIREFWQKFKAAFNNIKHFAKLSLSKLSLFNLANCSQSKFKLLKLQEGIRRRRRQREKIHRK